MHSMVGYDENYMLQFFNGWNDQKVTINGITFQVIEEVIAMVTSLSMKGKKWRKVTKIIDEANMNSFFGKMRSRFDTKEGLKETSCPPHGMMCV